jgi:hypothetical protein
VRQYIPAGGKVNKFQRARCGIRLGPPSIILSPVPRLP